MLVFFDQVELYRYTLTPVYSNLIDDSFHCYVRRLPPVEDQFYRVSFTVSAPHGIESPRFRATATTSSRGAINSDNDKDAVTTGSLSGRATFFEFLTVEHDSGLKTIGRNYDHLILSSWSRRQNHLDDDDDDKGVGDYSRLESFS